MEGSGTQDGARVDEDPKAGRLTHDGALADAGEEYPVGFDESPPEDAVEAELDHTPLPEEDPDAVLEEALTPGPELETVRPAKIIPTK